MTEAFKKSPQTTLLDMPSVISSPAFQDGPLFGEQVAAAAQWLCLVRSDLEALGYAAGAIPMEAASCDADHFRDRYWFVAHDDQQRQGKGWLQRGREFGGAGVDTENYLGAVADGNGEGLAQREVFAFRVVETPSGQARYGVATYGNARSEYLECPDGKWRRLPPPGVRWLGNGVPARVAKLRAFGNAIVPQAAAQFIRAYMNVVE